MKLIEDLGMRETGCQGQKTRYGLYECPICHKYFECRVSHVNRGTTTKCRRCADKSKSIKAARNFIEKALAIHGSKYDYTLVDYISSRDKVCLRCNTCSNIFNQTPNNHLRGEGCPQCAIGVSARIQLAKAANNFVEKALAIHGTKYTYTLFNYTGNKVKGKIGCVIHGVYEQTPDAHLRGQGCPCCAISGFDKSKPAIVYYLKVAYSGTILYKIGITNKSVNERFNNEDLDKITVLKIWEYDIGADAYDIEQQVLKQHKEYKYLGEPILSSGNTELFTIDVLQLDSYEV